MFSGLAWGRRATADPLATVVPAERHAALAPLRPWSDPDECITAVTRVLASRMPERLGEATTMGERYYAIQRPSRLAVDLADMTNTPLEAVAAMLQPKEWPEQPLHTLTSPSHHGNPWPDAAVFSWQSRLAKSAAAARVADVSRDPADVFDGTSIAVASVTPAPDASRVTEGPHSPAMRCNDTGLVSSRRSSRRSSLDGRPGSSLRLGSQTSAADSRRAHDLSAAFATPSRFWLKGSSSHDHATPGDASNHQGGPPHTGGGTTSPAAVDHHHGGFVATAHIGSSRDMTAAVGRHITYTVTLGDERDSSSGRPLPAGTVIRVFPDAESFILPGTSLIERAPVVVLASNAGAVAVNHAAVNPFEEDELIDRAAIVATHAVGVQLALSELQRAIERARGRRTRTATYAASSLSALAAEAAVAGRYPTDSESTGCDTPRIPDDFGSPQPTRSQQGSIQRPRSAALSASFAMSRSRQRDGSGHNESPSIPVAPAAAISASPDADEAPTPLHLPARSTKTVAPFSSDCTPSASPGGDRAAPEAPQSESWRAASFASSSSHRDCAPRRGEAHDERIVPAVAQVPARTTQQVVPVEEDLSRPLSPKHRASPHKRHPPVLLGSAEVVGTMTRCSFPLDTKPHIVALGDECWSPLVERADAAQVLQEGGGFYSFCCKTGAHLTRDALRQCTSIVNLSKFRDEKMENNVPVLEMCDHASIASLTFIVVKATYVLPIDCSRLTPALISSVDFQKHCQPGSPKVETAMVLPPDTFRITKQIIRIVFSIVIQLSVSLITDPAVLQQLQVVDGLVPDHALLMERTKRDHSKVDGTVKVKSILLYYKLPAQTSPAPAAAAAPAEPKLKLRATSGAAAAGREAVQAAAPTPYLVTNLTVVVNSAMPGVVASLMNTFSHSGATEVQETALKTRKYLAGILGDVRTSKPAAAAGAARR